METSKNTMGLSVAIFCAATKRNLERQKDRIFLADVIPEN
jgi:hypothetical protein